MLCSFCLLQNKCLNIAVNFYKFSYHFFYEIKRSCFHHQPSTFQAVLATDGCDTYVIYLYEERGMLWNTTLRSSNVALIGYTNGAGTSFNETQSEYRPDARQQRQSRSNFQNQIFHFTCITPKCVRSWWGHFLVLALTSNTALINKMLQWWRVTADTVSDLNCSRFRSQTSRSRGEHVPDRPTDQQK